jgi:hypothetical protein
MSTPSRPSLRSSFTRYISGRFAGPELQPQQGKKCDMFPLHFTYHDAQVFVHEKVKVWSASLETMNISVEESDSDLEIIEL